MNGSIERTSLDGDQAIVFRNRFGEIMPSFMV
jgi:hypothetical protein